MPSIQLVCLSPLLLHLESGFGMALFPIARQASRLAQAPSIDPVPAALNHQRQRQPITVRLTRNYDCGMRMGLPKIPLHEVYDDNPFLMPGGENAIHFGGQLPTAIINYRSSYVGATLLHSNDLSSTTITRLWTLCLLRSHFQQPLYSVIANG